MSEDIEERFRAACSAYLAAAEYLDGCREAEGRLAESTRRGEQAVDRARDELLQVVRERDLQQQLGAGQTVVYPSDGAAAARDRWLTSPGVNVVRPEDTGHWAKHGGMCPECGVSWRKPSEDCPHKVVNWHPLSNDYTVG